MRCWKGQVPIRAATEARSLVGLFVLAWSLACGGGGANVAACESFVEHYNGLPCNAVRIDESGRVDAPDPICSSHLDDSVELQPYFACLEAGMRCEEDLLVVDVSACRPQNP